MREKGFGLPCVLSDSSPISAVQVFKASFRNTALIDFEQAFLAASFPGGLFRGKSFLWMTPVTCTCDRHH
jgi:hypothetical protein